MIYTDQPIFDAIAAAAQIDSEPDGIPRIVMSATKFIEVFNNHRDRALCTSLNAPAQGAPDREATSEFVRRLRRYNAAHLAYDLSHDEAIDALLALTSTNDQLIANKGDSAS